MHKNQKRFKFYLIDSKTTEIIDETKDIPVVALTADAMDSDVKEALDMGFNSYVTKPIDVPRFLDTLDNILSN